MMPAPAGAFNTFLRGKKAGDELVEFKGDIIDNTRALDQRLRDAVTFLMGGELTEDSFNTFLSWPDPD
jgi:hypothetical protein